MNGMFASLRIPNYRNWFIGATFSNIGRWLATTAQSWLVLTILTDHNALALGIQTALAFLPSLLLAPWVGAVADMFAKKSVLKVTNSVLLFDSIILSTLVITGAVELWMVYLLATIDGVAAAFDQPSKQAIVAEIVPHDSLPNAISLNSASFNTARIIGPGCAGVAIAAIGTGPVIALNAASFIAMLICIHSLNSEAMFSPPTASKAEATFTQGIRYVRRHADLKVLLFIGFAVGGLSFNFNISNAVMATVAFGKASGEFGILGSLMGVGALTAALLSARRDRPRLRRLLLGMMGFSVFNLAAALSPNYVLFAILQVPVGYCAVMCLVGCNTLLQTSATPTMRGRVMALWGLMIMGVTPAVSPMIGRLGDVAGPRSTVLFGVIVTGVAAIGLTALIMVKDGIAIRIDRKAKLWLSIDHVGDSAETKALRLFNRRLVESQAQSASSTKVS